MIDLELEASGKLAGQFSNAVLYLDSKEAQPTEAKLKEFKTQKRGELRKLKKTKWENEWKKRRWTKIYVVCSHTNRGKTQKFIFSPTRDGLKNGTNVEINMERSVIKNRVVYKPVDKSAKDKSMEIFESIMKPWIKKMGKKYQYGLTLTGRQIARLESGVKLYDMFRDIQKMEGGTGYKTNRLIRSVKIGDKTRNIKLSPEQYVECLARADTNMSLI